jgi:hypothetical protein
MKDPPMGVPAFAAKVVLVFATIIDAGEACAQGNQFAHGVRPTANNSLYGQAVAQAIAGPQGVINVGFERVVDAPDTGNSALRIRGISLVTGGFSENRDGANAGCFDCEEQPGNAAANDQEIAAD